MVVPPRGHFEVELCYKGADLHSEFVPLSLQVSLQDIWVLGKSVYNNLHLEPNYLAHKHSLVWLHECRNCQSLGSVLFGNYECCSPF